MNRQLSAGIHPHLKVQKELMACVCGKGSTTPTVPHHHPPPASYHSKLLAAWSVRYLIGFISQTPQLLTLKPFENVSLQPCHILFPQDLMNRISRKKQLNTTKNKNICLSKIKFLSFRPPLTSYDKQYYKSDTGKIIWAQSVHLKDKKRTQIL